MKLTDRKAFIEVLLGFAELKGKQLSAAALELYWRAMRAWSIEDFRAAAEQLLRTCAFMPTPKDFEDLRKAARPTAGEAWAEVLEAARRGGGPPQDEATQKALRAIGGIQAVAMSDVSKTHFLERRFCEHFESIQDADDIRENVPQIAHFEPDTPQLSGPRKAP